MTADEPTPTSHLTGYWADLAADLADPEFLRAYTTETERTAAIDKAVQARVSALTVQAERLAAALALALHDAHPVNGSTAATSDGLGGSTVTTSCSFATPRPDALFAQHDLLETPLRDYMTAHPGFDLAQAKAALRGELERRLCPLDGEPLAEVHHAADAPTVFVHHDGTQHTDRLAEMRPPVQPLPGVQLPPHTDTRPGYVFVEFTPEPPDVPAVPLVLLCGDAVVLPGGGDCGPCRCVKQAGHVPTGNTYWEPDADHACACGARWDDPTEPNTDPLYTTGPYEDLG